MTLALEVSSLSYTYPDGHHALFAVDLSVLPGERVALLGPNGAGKTTLILHLNGVIAAQTGSVRVMGMEVEKRHLQEIRKRVGLVFQDPDDQLFMSSVREDVAFGPANLGFRGEDRDARVAGALAAVGMEAHADRPPHHLSFGQRRRVAVATVLSMEPDILVLDEPTSNLDPAGRRELTEVLDELPLTILMATHDLPYAAQMCERAIVMDEGAIVADGSTREILSDEALLGAHRLELPFGFDVSFTRPGLR